MARAKVGRRFVIGGIALALLASAVAVRLSHQDRDVDAAEITVYKSPQCGCCSKWAAHLRQHGFAVKEMSTAHLPEYKSRYGVTPELASCHTAVVEGYVIEGHVPAADIQRLLTERPEVQGLVVSGMPIGSPGMEGPHKKPYEVLSIGKEGERRVFSRH
jgi:hypothetical protein